MMNDRTSYISPLANLTDLEFLMLPMNRRAGISPLRDLSRLTVLGLDSNRVQVLHQVDHVVGPFAS